MNAHLLAELKFLKRFPVFNYSWHIVDVNSSAACLIFDHLNLTFLLGLSDNERPEDQNLCHISFSCIIEDQFVGKRSFANIGKISIHCTYRKSCAEIVILFNLFNVHVKIHWLKIFSLLLEPIKTEGFRSPIAGITN